MNDVRKQLTHLFLETLKAYPVSISEAEVEASLQVPKEEKFGDLSTHLILKIAKETKRPPRALAETFSKELWQAIQASTLASGLEKIAVEGPGFINFYYTRDQITGVLNRIKKERADFGRLVPETKRNILLEFVSANPTGPLTVAHGRQAALGDALAKILQFCGHRVTKEYYNNDEGVQIQTLGKSLDFRVEEKLTGTSNEIPENYYRGDYLAAIAEKLIAEQGADKLRQMPTAERLALCTDYSKDTIFLGIQKDLADFSVTFDHYYSQKELGTSGKVEKTLQELKDKGVVYEGEGAVWLRSTDFGDDKDRVLIKSDKSYTYLTPDIAYHHEKFKRGFDEIIDILGPDHHGYIARLKASQAALGHDPNQVRVLIAQLVTLFEGDKQVRMSTRAGEFVTLRQILDEVGKDAGRFFFVMRKFDAHLDFDLALAKSQTPENPAFYIQYAHARIESIKNAFKEKTGALPSAFSEAVAPPILNKLSSAQEIRLMQLLSGFGEAVLGAANTLEPYRLVPYLMELAAAFHRFYAENRVVTEDDELTAARLVLIDCTQLVLRQGLGLLGVSAPLKM